MYDGIHQLLKELMMKHIFYLTLLTKEDYVVSLMSRNDEDIAEYIECSIGNTVNAFFKGGNKFDRTGILCSPHDPDARHLSGVLMDITMVSAPEDPNEPLVIQPLNQED